MGVVVGLFDETELLALRLVESALDTVCLLEALEGQDEQLGVVLVGERGEGNGGEAAALEPVDRGGVDSHRLLRCDVRPILQVVVLSLLLRLQVESGESTEVLLADCLVDSGSPADALSVVVGRVGPPVGLGLDVAQNHVLNWNGQTRHLYRAQFE